MKEYRLTSWPDLPAEYRHTRYQRVLHDMSQRFMSLKQLMKSSSMRRSEMRAFVRMLDAQEMLHERRRPASELGLGARLANLMLSPVRRLFAR